MQLPKFKFNKRVATFLTSIILFAAAALTVYFSLSAIKPNYPVVVAARDLTVGQQITADDITVKYVSQNLVPDQAATSPSMVTGKVLAGGPVFKGAVLVRQHVTNESSLVSTLVTFSPPGWVATELPEGTGLGISGIKCGDKVDIYSDLPIITQDNKAGTVSGLVVEEAIVLMIPEQGGKGTGKSYVVAVPPEKAKNIAELEVHNRKTAIVVKKGD